MGPKIEKFPDYYKQYSWSAKHKLFGYQKDAFPDFKWIKSLEERFLWLSQNSENEKTASKYLIQEMIEWGGSQNGVLQRFNDKSGEVNLYDLVQQVINNIDNPEMAISSALNFPGLGLTYASKLLRFIKPEKYGALDSRLRKALVANNLLKKINVGDNESAKKGYIEFLKLLKNFAIELKNNSIELPSNDNLDWNASQIEMALFCWAEENSHNNLSNEESDELNKRLGQGNGNLPDNKSSKMKQARQIFIKLKANNYKRKDIIKAFINEVHLTEKGAATYYQHLKSEAENPA